jgi:type II secretory pathway predicted ATPase ExeA
MYCDYFGFSEKPFDVTPDPRFLFMTPDHRETLASLIYGIQERRGFITVVGEVGTGKTTLLHAAMDRMDEKTQVAFIFNTDVTFNEMLNMALYDWGLTEDIKKLSKVEAIQRLNRFAIDQLSKGGNVVLILDEAHILSRNAMENLRLLSNLETRKHKLIQIILSGQPELDTKLDRHELRQLAQRINLRRYIYPLNKTCTFSYLRHRLSVVTNSDSLPFDNKAEKMIWEYSGGIPRKINMLCDNALLIGYGLGKKKIDGTIIQEAAKDLKWDRFSKTNTPLNYSPIETESTSVEKKPPRRFLKLAATVVITGILVTAGSFIMNKKEFQLPKLTNFLNGIKATVSEIIHPEHAKELAQVSKLDIHEQTVIGPKTESQKVPKENPESKSRVTNNETSYLDLSNYHIVKEKTFDLFLQHNELEKKRQLAALNDNDESYIKDTEEKKTRQIVVKKGDNLASIIQKNYGLFNDVILNKVLIENPDVTNPNFILPDQVIKLPSGKKTS